MTKRLPSPALVIAILALVVAMGGTSYAALHLGKNSVGAKQLKPSAVRSAKVADGTLLARDFKAGQLPAGAAGPQGAPGEQGVAGPAGPTQGVAHGFVDPPPMAQTVADVNKVTITTKSPGSLYVTSTLAGWLSGCPGPSECVVHLGLYVDGEPVPGTQTEMGFSPKAGKDFEGASVAGVQPGVPAGTHSIAMRVIDIPANTGGFGQDFATSSAVLLGN